MNTKFGHLEASSYGAGMPAAERAKPFSVENSHSIAPGCTTSMFSAKHSFNVVLVVSEIETSLEGALVDGTRATAGKTWPAAVFKCATELGIICPGVSFLRPEECT